MLNMHSFKNLIISARGLPDSFTMKCLNRLRQSLGRLSVTFRKCVRIFTVLVAEIWFTSLVKSQATVTRYSRHSSGLLSAEAAT